MSKSEEPSYDEWVDIGRTFNGMQSRFYRARTAKAPAPPSNRHTEPSVKDLFNMARNLLGYREAEPEPADEEREEQKKIKERTRCQLDRIDREDDGQDGENQR